MHRSCGLRGEIDVQFLFMKSAYVLLTSVLCFLPLPLTAQSTAKSSRPAAVPKVIPPFSGSWIYDPKQSVVTNRISGVSSAVISYDGKTWQYTHRHQASPDEQPDAWQITLAVDSPKYQLERGEELAFRSRISRQGKGLLLDQLGATPRGERFHNTTRYTLSDDGNTLTETEISVSRLGKTTNKYVLVREGHGATLDGQ